MSKRGNFFVPTDTGSPPPMDFTFTNTGQSRATPTHRDYFSENQLNHSSYVHKTEQAGDFVSPNSPIPYAQMPSKKLKPGPISRSELSSGANVHKLRVENVLSTQRPASSTRLRQEVFKKPHTLAPSLQSLDAATTARFAPTQGLSISGDAVSKASTKQMKHGRVLGTSPAPSTPLKSESSPDIIRASGRIDVGQRRRSSAHGKSSSLSLSTIQPLLEAPNPDIIRSGDISSRATISPSIPADLPQIGPRYHTPARGSVVPTTPSSEKSIREDTSDIHDLRRKCELYEVEQKFDRDRITSQSQTIEELSNENAQMEEQTRNLESKHAAEVKEITKRADVSLTKLTDLHEKSSQTSASQLKELKQGLDNLRQEIRDSLSAVEPLLAGYGEMKNSLREIAEEYEQQILEQSDERTRLQQTNDLLRDQLSDRTGSYTESLEREKELQSSLIALGASHANVAKSFSTLHQQHEQVNTKYADSRFAESAARKRIEELEEVSADLKIDNARMKSLLADNEQAFSRKLQALEEDNDSMRTSLKGAHKELGASKSGEQVARSQAEALFREKEDISQSNLALERNLELKIQSLDEARARNQALERQLSDEKRNLEKARAEGDHTMGRLIERDQATSVQIQELNTALESHRERECSLISELATLNALVSTLREKVKEANEMDAEHQALEKALLEKRADIVRVEVENGQLQSQVVQLELSRDALNEENKQLRENGCVAREREAAAQKDLHGLRESLKIHHDEGEKTRTSIARVEAELEQIKMALEKEKDAHKVTEKSVLDKTSTTEKKLRSSVDGSQERIKKLENECTERENALNKLRHELNASNAAKATLEALVSEFKTSAQHACSQRDKIEAQEGKLTILSTQVSSQEAELRLLKEQLVNSDARLVESRADVNAQRATAESARASAAAFEVQLKQKEHDIEVIRSELQSRQLLQTSTTTDNGPISSLRNKIAEQESTIESLGSQVLELEKSSETIVERYKGGKLTNSEKDLVGLITAGIVQEKNRTINNLRGELKRKENEVETHKITVAELKAQLESNGSEDPAGWQSFNNKRMTVSSSPLSDIGWHAPDQDPPTPDSPAVQLADRPLQNSRGHEQAQPHNSNQSTRSKAQPRTLIPIMPESGNTADEIQEFESEVPQDTVSTGRKRGMVNIEPLDDEDQEEPEHDIKRKTRVKAKKDYKVAGENNGPKGQPNKTDGPSTSAKGKAAKRRKV
ncbi:hypothetical protein RSOL_417190, partial [Rhizoctonia solani AG-3 Rhs1AP]